MVQATLRLSDCSASHPERHASAGTATAAGDDCSLHFDSRVRRSLGHHLHLRIRCPIRWYRVDRFDDDGNLHTVERSDPTRASPPRAP